MAIRRSVWAVTTLAFMAAPVCLRGAQENGSPEAPSQEKRLGVAVLSFENRTDDPHLAHWRHGAVGLLRRQLRKIDALGLSSEGLISRAFQKAHLRTEDHLDPNLARELGEHAEAQRVIWGSYSRKEERWSLDAWVMNVATGTLSAKFSASAEDWFDLCDKLTLQILAHLGIVPSDDEKTNMARRWTGSSEALDWYYRACAYQEQGSLLAEQETCLRKALKADPNGVNALVSLAAVLADQRRDDEAKDIVRKALRLDPDSADAHSMLAIAYLHLGEDTQKAQEEIREACRLDPNNSRYLLDFAQIYMSDGKWVEATRLLEKTILLDPMNAQSHALMAFARATQHLTDKAIWELKEAERLDGQGVTLVNVELLMGSTYRLLDERMKAIEHLERFVALNRSRGGDPEKTARWERVTKDLRASLTPAFIDAPMPRRYTREALDGVLQEKLTQEELGLVINPLGWNQRMQEWAKEMTQGASTDLEKAKALYDKLSRRVDGNSHATLRTAEGVFEAWNNTELHLNCVEHALLFVALARAVDVNAFFVCVDQDASGKAANHACAAIFTEGRAILVDTLWRWFGVPDKQYTILDDVETTAFLCFEKLDHPMALQFLRAGLKLWPGCLGGQLSLVTILYNNHQFEEAQRVLAAITEPQAKNCDTADYWCLRGRMAEQQQHFNEAQEFLLRAVSIWPDDADAHFVLGRVYLKQRRLVEARTEFRACLGGDPPSRTATAARHLIAQINEEIGFDSAPGTTVPEQKPQ
jgi:tetratricopeptide (TPR) repeat protein